jgi:transposase-like protein
MASLRQMTDLELEAVFPDEGTCKAYLASHRWPDRVSCPRCGNPKVYQLAGFTWQCQACNRKGYRFSVLVGTIFEDTKISLKKWFRAVHLMLTKRDVTIVEIQRTIGLGSNRSAWLLARRIRHALADDDFRKLVGVAEVNEDSKADAAPRPQLRPTGIVHAAE